jgi:hypothetical protein
MRCFLTRSPCRRRYALVDYFSVSFIASPEPSFNQYTLVASTAIQWDELDLRNADPARRLWPVPELIRPVDLVRYAGDPVVIVEQDRSPHTYSSSCGKLDDERRRRGLLGSGGSPGGGQFGIGGNVAPCAILA